MKKKSKGGGGGKPPSPAPTALTTALIPAVPAAVPVQEASSAPVAPVNIHTKAALNLLRLKCPTIRNYLSGAAAGAELRSGLNRILAPFDTGPENAQRVCSPLPDFDQAQFDLEMQEGQLPGQPCYSCERAITDGATMCPTGGCILPDGERAKAPSDLLEWGNCDLKEVGHTVIAKSVAASEYDNKILTVRDKMYAYHDGFYPEIGDRQLFRKVLPHLGTTGKVSQAAAIGEMMNVQCAEPLTSITPSQDHICFQNGTLNVTATQLEAHSPAHMLRNRIPHSYIADAACPRFLAFLNSVWEGDADRPEKIRLIRQWIGYLFVADTRMQKMLILKGDGDNGKSVLMKLIRSIVGEANTSDAMLHGLRNADIRANMECNLLNISADLPKASIVADGDLKAMITGDPVEASAKYVTSHSISPYVRFMVSTNHLPECKDKSPAYTRRLIILEFNRKFEGDARDPNLKDTLMHEIPGVIAWAVEGLYDLREQCQFSEPPSSVLAVLAYRQEIDPVKWFADECLVASTDRSGFKSKDLHKAYKAWSRDQGLQAESVIEFGRRLSAQGFSRHKSGTTWWRATAKESAREYFSAAKIVPEVESTEPEVAEARLELAPAPATAAPLQQEAPEPLAA